MPTKTTQAMGKGIKSAKKKTSKPAKTKVTTTIKDQDVTKPKSSKVMKMKKATTAKSQKSMKAAEAKKSKALGKTAKKTTTTKAKKLPAARVKQAKPTKVKSAKTATLKGKNPGTIKAVSSATKSVAPKTPSKKSTTKDKKVAKTIMSISTLEVTKGGDVSGTGFLGIPPYKEESGEEYMNERQQSHFRVLLERWKQALMEEVDRTMHHMKDEAANFPDLSDRASQEEEFNLELRARDRERKLIWKIDEALERIEQNDYGYCDACGVEIGIRRLEARPTATLCIDCKTLDEIREKQTRA